MEPNARSWGETDTSHICTPRPKSKWVGGGIYFFVFGSCARLWQCEKRADNCLQISPFVWQPLLLRNNFNDRHCWWVLATMSRPLRMLALGLEKKLKIFWLNIEQTWCGKCGAEGWKGIRCYVVEKSTMISEDGLRFEPKSTITGSCEYNSWENPYLNAFPKFIHSWKTPMLCNFVNSVSQLTKTFKIIVEIFTNCQNGQ